MNARIRGLLLGCCVLVLPIGAADYAKEVESVKTGKIKEAKASWWGFDKDDATKCLQSALNSGAKKVIVDNTGSDWIVTPIKVPSDIEIVFQEGVTVRAKKGEFKKISDSLFEISGRKNVILRGEGKVLFVMNKKDYQDSARYKKSEHRHTIRIYNSDGVTVRNLTLRSSGGDGVYVGSFDCKNIILEKLICEDHHRQGISITGVDNFLAKDCVFNNTGGTAPECGLDLEPNYPDGKVGLRNVVFENCEFNHNKTFGIYVANNSRKKIDVTFKHCRIQGNSEGIGVGHVGHPTTPKDGTPGTLAFLNCTVGGNRNTQVSVGHHLPDVKLIFRDCTIDARNSRFQALRISSDNQDDIDGLEISNLTVLDDLPRDPILFESRYGNGLIRPRIGTVTVRNSKGESRGFDPAELIRKSAPDPLAKSFRVLPVDRKCLAPVSAKKVFGNETIRLRGKNEFLVAAKAGDLIRLKFINRPVHRYEGKSYRDPLEIVLDTPTLDGQKRLYVPFDGVLDYTLDAQENGIYRFRMDARSQTLSILSDAPGQAFPAGEKLYVFGCGGEFYFAVPAGVKEVKVEMNGAPREESTVELVDPSGRTVDKAERFGGGKILVGKRSDDSRFEVWKIRFGASKLWLRLGAPLVPLFSTAPEHLLVFRKDAAKYAWKTDERKTPVVGNGDFRETVPARKDLVLTSPSFPKFWSGHSAGMVTGEDHRNRIVFTNLLWHFLTFPKEGGRFTGTVTAYGKGELTAYLSTDLRTPGGNRPFRHKKRPPVFGPFTLTDHPRDFYFDFTTAPYEQGYLYLQVKGGEATVCGVR